MPYLTFPLNFAANVGFPIKQSPLFNTIVQSPASGRGEIHIPLMNFPRWEFEIPITVLPGDNLQVNSQWQEFINFYMGVQGQGNYWYFIHPYDNNIGTYTIAGALSSGVFKGNFPGQLGEFVKQTGTGATAQLISVVGGTMTIWPYSSGSPNNSGTWVGQTSGAVFTPSGNPALATSMAIATGDGTTTAFTMLRTFVTGGAQDMIQNFVNPPLIYISNSLQSSSNYTIDEYGTITFNTAPGNTDVVSWTGNFAYLAVFTEDTEKELQENWSAMWECESLRFRSILQ